MAYFPNGTAGMIFEEEWCCRCVHSPLDPDAPGCTVWLSHLLYSYELCNEMDHPGKIILDLLIEDGGPADPVKCTMFHERSAELAKMQRRAVQDRKKYEAAMAEMKRRQVPA